MTRRMDRVNALLRQEISRVLTIELKDPRLSSVVSITHVDSSPDLKRARVFVSVLGDKDAKKRTLTALKSARGFIHRSIRQQLTLKAVPTLEFRLDESIEQGAEMLERIRDLAPYDAQEQA
ncbi:MAG: 30S ribosome-binding factor RbfA [Chloroflexi bacterium]|nr:30S ribosome-binding factor RbfA [Chloroflexota bacterium]